MRKYFGTDGVRGKANVFPMTSEFALRLGLAAGHKFLRQGEPPHQVVIGKDTRLSCYMFEAALVAGICSQGVDAVLVGSLPTPAIAFMAKTLRANAGIVISASHNPYYDNGIKFFDSEGYKLPDETELELEQMVDGDIPLSADIIGKALRIDTAVGRYVEFVKATFDKRMDLRGMKIVLDCANGACYKVAPAAIMELGAEVVVINAEPNGTNINADCGATHPETVSAKVKEVGADVGISFDGDGDRVIMCDHEGTVVDGDFIMGICAIDLKNNNLLKNNTVVGTVMSNQGFVRSLNSYGIDVLRTKVGDRYVIEAMRAGGHTLGGEQSGHLIFSEHSTTGDGLISALQLLKVMAKTGKSLKDLAKSINIFPQVLLNVMVQKKVPIGDLPATKGLIEKIQAELGDEGRVLVRYSGTENKLRVMTEGSDYSRIGAYAADIAHMAEKEIQSIGV